MTGLPDWVVAHVHASAPDPKDMTYCGHPVSEIDDPELLRRLLCLTMQAHEDRSKKIREYMAFQRELQGVRAKRGRWWWP